MKRIVQDSVYREGIAGQLVATLEWAAIDREREPSGHYFDVMAWAVKGRWFHPYNGNKPIEVTYDQPF